MNDKLYSAIMKWEGWGRNYREALYDDFCTEKNFLKDLVYFYENDESLRCQVTWLMRQYMENGNQISEDLLKRIMAKTDELILWWSKASLLRVVTLGVRTPQMAQICEKFVRSCLKESKIVVLAFAHEAFGVLALNDEKYQKEAKKLFKKGIDSDSAAVFSKSRKALEKLAKQEKNN